MIKHIRWRLFLPLLRLEVELPLVELRTCVLYRRLETRTVEYVALFVRVHRWHFDVALYNTDWRVELRGLACRKKEV